MQHPHFPSNQKTERSWITSTSRIVAGWTISVLFHYFSSLLLTLTLTCSVLVPTASVPTYKYLLPGLAERQAIMAQISLLSRLRARQSKPTFSPSPFRSARSQRRSKPHFLSLVTFHDRAYPPAVEQLTTTNPAPLTRSIVHPCLGTQPWFYLLNPSY